MKVPDRWLNYTNGARIHGTRFVACKAPLKEDYFRNLPPDQRFTPSDLCQKFPNVRMIIDLTFTYKYYDGKNEFCRSKYQYVKLKCKGHRIPREAFKTFADVVDHFTATTPNDYLIAVHCTHGVNRTGYLIVRYMIERLGFTPREALIEFARFRGHPIERVNYIEDLHERAPLVRSNLSYRC